MSGTYVVIVDAPTYTRAFFRQSKGDMEILRNDYSRMKDTKVIVIPFDEAVATLIAHHAGEGDE